MSRFGQGRWNRILVWTAAALAWGSALVASHFAPGFSVVATPPVPGQGETIGGSQTMPSAPDRGLILIRLGRDLEAQPADQPSQTFPGPAPAPEMTSSGS